MEKLYKKLIEIQQELKAPKGQYNDFGNYKYRSLDNILEAVKPLLEKRELVLLLYDELVSEGEGTSARFYIKATAELIDTEGHKISVTALAREALAKKGMDESQITGTASSYARKYCLNGLFAIDDTKDADTNEYKKQTAAGEPATASQRVELTEKCREKNVDPQDLLKSIGWDGATKMSKHEYKEAIKKLEGMP